MKRLLALLGGLFASLIGSGAALAAAEGAAGGGDSRLKSRLRYPPALLSPLLASAQPWVRDGLEPPRWKASAAIPMLPISFSCRWY